MAEKGKRGFASMDREKQRQIASKGGKAAHQKGTAHKFTPEEARQAGRKGGQVAHQRGKAHEFTPEEAREAARKAGQGIDRSNGVPALPNEPFAEGTLPDEPFAAGGVAQQEQCPEPSPGAQDREDV